MSKFIAAAPPALKGERPAMNNQITSSSPREDQYGEDPFALTQNCDYVPPSKVSVEFSLNVVGTRLRCRTPREVVPHRSSVRSCPNFGTLSSVTRHHQNNKEANPVIRRRRLQHPLQQMASRQMMRTMLQFPYPSQPLFFKMAVQSLYTSLWLATNTFSRLRL